MESIFLKILSMSLVASVVILVVLVLRLFLKRTPKYVNCILWGIVAVRLILPIAIESNFSLIPEALSQNRASEYTVHENLPSEEEVVVFYESDYDFSEPVVEQGSLEISNEANSISALSIVSYIWVIGVATMVAYSIISSIVLQNKLKSGIIVENSVCVSDSISTPFVFGVVKPRIYIPSSLPQNVVSYVIAHESAHVKRGDNIWKILAFLLLSVYWFNPLMWIAFVAFEKDMELACDERVIAKMDVISKKEYANALLTCSLNKKAAFVYPVCFGEIGIKERIMAVKNYKKSAAGFVLISLLICILVAGCFLTDPKLDEENEPEDTTISGENETVEETTTTAETTIGIEMSESSHGGEDSNVRTITICSNTEEIDDVVFEAEECTVTPWRYTFDGYCLIVYSFVDGDTATPIYAATSDYLESSHVTGTLNDRVLICDTFYFGDNRDEAEVEYRIGGYESDVCFYLTVGRNVGSSSGVEVDIDASEIFYTEGVRISSVELKEDRIIFFVEGSDTLHTAYSDVIFTIIDVDGNEYELSSTDFSICGYHSIVSNGDEFRLLVHFTFVDAIPFNVSDVSQIIITSDINGASATIDFNN